MSNPCGERRKRREHTNSHHGCMLCKKRHLKCDEVKPVCGQCARKGLDESCDYLKARANTPRATSELQLIKVEPTVNHIGTPISWSRVENHLMFDLNQLIEFTSASDKGYWRNILFLDLYAHWKELAFKSDCIRHALNALFAPAFPGAVQRSRYDLIVETQVQLAITNLRQELLLPSEDNMEVIEATSYCLQIVHGLNGLAKEWHTFASGAALARRLIRNYHDGRTLPKVNHLPADGIALEVEFQDVHADHSRLWIPGNGYARSTYEQNAITTSYLNSLGSLKSYVETQRKQQETVEHMIGCVRTFQSMSVPSTPEQRLWFWSKLDQGFHSYPAQCGAILNISPMDVLLSCILESIPILFPHLFFPDEVLAFCIAGIKEIVIRLYDHLTKLPPEGDLETGCDRSTLLSLALPAYHVASTFPLVVSADDYDIKPQWPEIKEETRVFEIEDSMDDLDLRSRGSSPFVLDVRPDPVDGLYGNFVRHAYQPYPDGE